MQVTIPVSIRRKNQPEKAPPHPPSGCGGLFGSLSP